MSLFPLPALLRAWWLSAIAAVALYVVINVWLWPKRADALREEG